MKDKTTRLRRSGDQGAKKQPADETLQKLKRGEQPGQDWAHFEARQRELDKKHAEIFGYPEPGKETPLDRRIQALGARVDAVTERLPLTQLRRKQETVPSEIVHSLNQMANNYIALLFDVAGAGAASSRLARRLFSIRSSLSIALMNHLPPSDARAAAQYQIYKKKMSLIRAAQYALGLELDDIGQPTVLEGRLNESKRRFDAVARRAAELAEDIKSLEPSERTQISKMLQTELASFFSGAMSPVATDKEASPFPILPSSEVLSEKARRKPPMRKWLKRDRSLKQTPAEFIRETYGDRLGRGFTQADLKACDKSCYDALHQWLRRIDPETGKQNRIPPNVDLPSVEDWNARRVRQLRMHPGSIDDEERQRLSYIIAGRTYRGNEIK